MERSVAWCISCALMVLLGGQAQAGVEVQYAALSSSLFGSGGQSAAQAFVPRFDTQNGQRVLTGVEIGGNAMVLANATATNNGVMPFSYSLSCATEVVFSQPWGFFSGSQLQSRSEPLLMLGEARSYQILLDVPISGVVADLAAFSSSVGSTALFNGTFSGLLTLPSCRMSTGPTSASNSAAR